MHFTSSTAALALLSLASAQGYGNSGTSASAPASASPASTSTAAAGVHPIAVGQGGAFTFTPNSLTASVGDQVQFNFASAGHAVAEAAFSTPCVPSNASAIYSGFVDSGKQWTITINSTDPLWFYCTQVSHCQAGMVGVINPPAGQSIDDFASAAKGTSSSQAPATVQGGLFQAAAQPGVSGTSASASSPSPSSGAGALKMAGLAGMAVLGGAVVWQTL